MSEEKTCPNCGAALMPGDVFCGECGARTKAPTPGVAQAASPDDVFYETEDMPPAKMPHLAAEPTAGEYIPPPPAKRERSSGDALRIVAIVVAVVFLLLSLCFCSLGGLMLVPTEDYPTVVDSLPYATPLCFLPGVFFGLLGLGAAYFGFRKQ